MTSNETCLAAEISGPIIYEGISFNLSQKPRLEKVLYCQEICQKVANLQREGLYPGIFWV